MGEIRSLSSSQVSATHTVDYCGNVIYEGGNLSKILTEEGYITFSGSTPTYHYYLKDHQGNNRVVTYWNGSKWFVEQVNHYYPFGGVFAEGTAVSNQAYKYNGKELDQMHGVDWYDYGARMHDAALGRSVLLQLSRYTEDHALQFSGQFFFCFSGKLAHITHIDRKSVV